MPETGPAPGSKRLLVLASLIGAAAVIGQLLTWPGPDVAWNLYAGQEVLRGARVGVEVLENTPPMIFWLERGPLLLAAAVGWGLWPAWVLCLMAAAVTSAVLSGLLLPGGSVSDHHRGAVVGAAAVILLLVPGGDFGQREHLAFILILPAVILTARRLSGNPVHPAAALAVGLLAGLGVGIKPHFVLVWGGLVSLVASRRAGKAILLPEHIAVAVVGVCYLSFVLVWAPDYLRYARAYLPLYQHFLPLGPWDMVRYGDGLVTGLVGLGVWCSVRAGLTPPRRAVLDGLGAATLAFYLAAVVQGKGWRYHFLPSILAGALLILWGLTRSPPTLSWIRRTYRWVGAAALGALLVSAGWDTAHRLVRSGDPALAGDPNMPALARSVADLPRSETLAVLSTNIASGFPLTLTTGLRWWSRFPSLWPLVALYQDQVETGGLVRFRPAAEQSVLEREFAAAVREDLLRRRPAVILMPRPALGRQGWGGALRFDYLQFLRTELGLGDAWLSGYRLKGDVGDYLVFRRADLP